MASTKKLMKKFQNVFVFNVVLAAIFGFIYFLIGMNTENFYVPEDKKNFMGAFYFAFVTQSTSGYGDITPKSTLAKIVNFFQLISIIFSAIVS